MQLCAYEREDEIMSDLKAFAAEARDWLEANCPEEMRQPITSDKDICWGGRNWTFQSEAQKRIGARSPLDSFGIWMLGPALLKFGTEEQKLEFLPPVARGEIRWCQGYSEPSAGSDLASLATKCEDMGDHFIVNGQKVWTSYADQADWIFCLVRTDNSGAKVAEAEIDEWAFGLTMSRKLAEAKAGASLGADSSMLKYYGTELNKRKYELTAHQRQFY